MPFVSDVPAYLRMYRGDIDRINEKILGEPVLPPPKKSKPKQTRTPSMHVNPLAPNGIDQLLKERGKRTVSAAQTTTATRGSSSSGSGISYRTKVILALVFGFIAIVLQLVAWQYSHNRDQDHEEAMARIHVEERKIGGVSMSAKVDNGKPEIQPSQQQPSRKLLPPGGTLYAADGDQFIIPEDAKTIVPQGATIVIVNSAHRIKSFSGDFTVQQLGAEKAASTPDNSYFRRLPKLPTQTKVRIIVNSGTVELGT